jgi:hypothetical protein
MNNIQHFIEQNKDTVREVYISPLRSRYDGPIEAWQVELNYGNETESFQGPSVNEALLKALVGIQEHEIKVLQSYNNKSDPFPGQVYG